MLEWVRTRTHLFPTTLQDRLVTGTGLHYSIRFTTGLWHYPNHYDCLDNYAFVLSGTRKVRLDRTTVRTLEVGDMLYLPSPQEHEFWCDTATHHLNILFNINFAPEHGRLECEEAFRKDYPFQVERLDQRIDYT
jgi:hypothetical protein